MGDIFDSISSFSSGIFDTVSNFSSDIFNNDNIMGLGSTAIKTWGNVEISKNNQNIAESNRESRAYTNRAIGKYIALSTVAICIILILTKK